MRLLGICEIQQEVSMWSLFHLTAVCGNKWAMRELNVIRVFLCSVEHGVGSAEAHHSSVQRAARAAEEQSDGGGSGTGRHGLRRQRSAAGETRSSCGYWPWPAVLALDFETAAQTYSLLIYWLYSRLWMFCSYWRCQWVSGSFSSRFRPCLSALDFDPFVQLD